MNGTSVPRSRKRGWPVMQRVVMALFLREIKTRFGKYQLGYAWALIEPIGSVAVMIAVFSALHAPGYPGIDFPVFLGVGVVINSLFVEIANRSIKAIEANTTLFNYRPVRPIDTVLARALLECTLHMAVFAVLALGYLAWGGRMEFHDLPSLLLVFLLLTAFSAGVGVLFMLITDAYSDADKVLPLLTRPLFFISGVFFSIESVPREYWPLFLWNPIFHAIELARMAVAPGYIVQGVSMGYLALSAAVTLTLAMAFYQRRERRLRLR